MAVSPPMSPPKQPINFLPKDGGQEELAEGLSNSYSTIPVDNIRIKTALNQKRIENKMRFADVTSVLSERGGTSKDPLRAGLSPPPATAAHYSSGPRPTLPI
jgi:hypothetical protein